jgi:hypothetical protein
MRCFEVNLVLVDEPRKKTLKQYFQHENYGDAISSSIAWAHLRMKEFQERQQFWVIDGLSVHEWRIDTPETNGEINSCKFLNKVLNWSVTGGIVEIYPLTEKQKQWVLSAILKLSSYRYYQSIIKIEERTVGGDMGDGEISFKI